MSPRRTESLGVQQESGTLFTPTDTPGILSPSPRPVTTTPQPMPTSRRSSPVSVDEDDERRPKWKKAVGKIWPT